MTAVAVAWAPTPNFEAFKVNRPPGRKSDPESAAYRQSRPWLSYHPEKG